MADPAPSPPSQGASQTPNRTIGTIMPSDGVDPNVKLPPSVMAASRLAMEAHQRAYGPVEGNPNGQGANGGTPPNGQGVQAAQTPNGQATQQEPGSQQAAAPAPSVQEELPELNADGSINWENRFKALKGRYDADTRRSRETQEQYEQRLNELQRNYAQATRPQLPGEGDPPVLVNPQEIADYGADFVDMVKRAAVEAVMPMLKPIATEVGTMRGRIETTESETGRQFVNRMHGAMDGMIPGWQELNRDPNFIAWTRQNDIYSGLNRQELLQKAWYAGDSNRVAAFFRGYLAEEAATNPAAAQARQQQAGAPNGHAAPNGGAPAPNGAQQPAGRVTLESLAAPGRARAAVVPTPAGKPIWTAEGISQFYLDVARGVFRGRDAERIATEQDLMNAQREGRIQYNPRTATHLGGNG